MELKDYTIEELRAEIKRRNELAREANKEAKKQELRCRHCKHIINHPKVIGMYLCGVKTWGKTYPRHSVELWTKACDKFEKKN